MSSPQLDRLLAASRLVGIDIGARGGFSDDLAPIGAAVEAIGFEPDQTECARLNESAKTDTLGYRALRYVPTAVGRAAEQRTLNLYRKRGCSSLLEGNIAFAKQFARDHWFILDEQIPLTTERLDDAAQRFGFTDAAFMKIDIQGAELEAMQSAPKLVSESLLCIRSEVEFAPLYIYQPLFADIDAELRGKGFMLVGFPELHSWRRGSEAKPDRWSGGSTPLSEPEVIHGDALYFRRPDLLEVDTQAGQDRAINHALLSFVYGRLDLCASVLSRPPVAARIRDLSGGDAQTLIADLGRLHVSRQRRRMGRSAFKQLREYLRVVWR
jgi:FkbM family methyltransferase